MICTVVNNVNKTFALRYIAITDGYIASNEELRIISKVKKMDSLSIKVYKVQLFSFCCIIDLDHMSQAMRFKEFKSNRFFFARKKARCNETYTSCRGNSWCVSVFHPLTDSQQSIVMGTQNCSIGWFRNEYQRSFLNLLYIILQMVRVLFDWDIDVNWHNIVDIGLFISSAQGAAPYARNISWCLKPDM